MFAQDALQLPATVNYANEKSEAANIDKYFRSEIIEKRNIKMAERAMLILKNNPTKSFFFAFGAGLTF